MRLNKKLLPVFILLVAVAIAAIMMATRKRLEPRTTQPPPVAVRVIEVYPGNEQLVVHAQGTVSPRTESSLVPEVSGNVTWVSPNLVSGGYFEKGEVLLKVDNRDYRDAVQRAEASLQRAEAEFQLAQFEYERADDLFERELISRIDLESKLRTARVNEASLNDAKLQLDTARRDLARTSLKAPFSGLVRSEQVDVGQFINRGNAVATVYASDYLEVRLPIADQQLAYLNIPLNQRGTIEESNAPVVELTAEFAGKIQTWQGKLVRAEGEIDPGSRMVYVIARVRAVQDEDQVPPPVGLFVQAEIAGLAVDDMVVLPRSALRNENQVLVVDQDDRLTFRTVEVLRVYRDEVYISAGINAGERVCVSNLQTVVEGMKVQPLMVEGQRAQQQAPQQTETSNPVLQDPDSLQLSRQSAQSVVKRTENTESSRNVTDEAESNLLAQEEPPASSVFVDNELARPEFTETEIEKPHTQAPRLDKPALDAISPAATR